MAVELLKPAALSNHIAASDPHGDRAAAAADATTKANAAQTEAIAAAATDATTKANAAQSAAIAAAATDATTKANAAQAAAIAASAPKLLTYTSTALTAYTLLLADLGLKTTAATAVFVTLPTDATAAIPIGTVIPWRQMGAGQITFAAEAGATMYSRGGATKSAGQYAGGTATKDAANVWIIDGDITSS